MNGEKSKEQPILDRPSPQRKPLNKTIIAPAEYNQITSQTWYEEPEEQVIARAELDPQVEIFAQMAIKSPGAALQWLYRQTDIQIVSLRREFERNSPNRYIYSANRAVKKARNLYIIGMERAIYADKEKYKKLINYLKTKFRNRYAKLLVWSYFPGFMLSRRAYENCQRSGIIDWFNFLLWRPRVYEDKHEYNAILPDKYRLDKSGGKHPYRLFEIDEKYYNDLYSTRVRMNERVDLKFRTYFSRTQNPCLLRLKRIPAGKHSSKWLYSVSWDCYDQIKILMSRSNDEDLARFRTHF